MEFRILFPFEVIADDERVELGRPQQRAFLAAMLLRANEVIPLERLIDNIWESDPPAKAVGTLQVYVSNLRKTLGPDRIVTRSAGCRLQVHDQELDLNEFVVIDTQPSSLRTTPTTRRLQERQSARQSRRAL